MLPFYAVIYGPGEPVRLSGSADQGLPESLGLDKAGIEGWLSSPDTKVTLTQRAVGDGAHDVPDADISYAERTVTIHWVAVGGSRDEVLHAALRLSALVHHTVRLRVVDASSDTFVSGYVRPQTDAAWHEDVLTGTLTIVCNRPERLAWGAFQSQLFPVSRVAGALSYGPEDKGLSYGSDGKGLTYGVAAGDQRNIGLLVNRGTSRAYPVLTVTGDFPDGVTLSVDGRTLRFEGRVGATPLILDSRSGTASMGGVDVGRQLTGRAFPVIPAGGSVSISLLSAGSGWVTCEVRDTYI